jgi:hypothetical protein
MASAWSLVGVALARRHATLAPLPRSAVRFLPIWWGGDSTAWLPTTSRPSVPSPRDVFVVRRSATSPRIASALVSPGHREAADAPSGGSVRAWTLLRRQTSCIEVIPQASASTASSGSASMGRAYSGPPSICAASPAGHVSSPKGRSTSLAAGPVFPQGHPSRSPPLAVPTVPRSAELQHDEDALAAAALVVLIVGTHPFFAPYQVRHFV